jgi:DNA sulfur modification protein DndC
MKKADSKSVNSLTREKLEQLLDDVRSTYLQDNRPWVIGYSGGKDSTATLQLVWNALVKIEKKKLTKPVYVISSDTFVETPVLVNYIDSNLKKINIYSQKSGLPFEAHKVTPAIEDTFWVNIIGKGYPAPSRNFRWCTDRMKIQPANQFITDKIAKFGEVVIVLGVRKAESTARAQVMSLRKDLGGRLSRHSDLLNAWVFTPIEDWETDDVWTYLLNSDSPWGNDNHELVTMYRNAQVGECPLVIDKTTPSCGSGRFGCWTCTVVEKDKSMEAMIDNGEEWLEPLLEIRNMLAETQEPKRKSLTREYKRRSGRIDVYVRNGENRIIWGPYKLEFRKNILKQLLKAQIKVRQDGPDPNVNLISREELEKIRQVWISEEGDWEDSLSSLYMEIIGDRFIAANEDWSGMGAVELSVLRGICEENNLPLKLFTRLFEAERQNHGMSRRVEIFDQIDDVLKQDWRTWEEVVIKEGLTAQPKEIEDLEDAD